MSQLSFEVWEKRQLLLSNPTGFCTVRDGTSEDFFFIDANLYGIFWFQTFYDRVNPRYVIDKGTHRPGPGSSVGQYNVPTSITVDPEGAGYIYKLYVLDAGNRRIQKLQANTYDGSFSHLGYIYDANGAAGPLNNPQDITFCHLEGIDIPGTDDGYILVADTGNHRILVLTADGQVRCTIGSVQGAGLNKFAFPTAVAAKQAVPYQSQSDIYVADCANNRVVRYVLEGTWQTIWAGEYSFGSENMNPETHWVPKLGLRDVAVDGSYSPWINSGVFVLDSKRGALVQLDKNLAGIIREYPVAASNRGLPNAEIELQRGELGVMVDYTRNTGLRDYEVRASIYDMRVSPTTFSPPLEWTTAQMKVSGAGSLVSVVKTVSAPITVIRNLPTTYVEPGVQYVIWDGKNNAGQTVASGVSYRIECTLTDASWPTVTHTQSVVVSVGPRDFRLVKAAYEIRESRWAPNGQSVTYASRSSSTAPRNLRRNILSTQQESTILASVAGDAHSWSPDGTKIAIGLSGASGSDIYLVNPDGTNLTQHTQSVSGTYRTDPQWLPHGNGISFVKYEWSGGGPKEHFKLNRVDIPNTGEAILIDTDEWPLYSDIAKHSWSSGGDLLAMALLNVNTNTLDFLYHDPSYAYTWSSGQGNVTTTIDNLNWSPSQNVVLFSAGDVTSNPINHKVKFAMPTSSTSWLANAVTDPAVILTLKSGMDWSPDGTKMLFSVESGTSPTADEELLIVDVELNEDAIPSAAMISPLVGSTIRGGHQIVGTVSDNIRSYDTHVLSSLENFYIVWGAGKQPTTWSDAGVTRTCGGQCSVTNGVLGTWQTAAIGSGEYTLRLIATDGEDSSIVDRSVQVVHETYTVASSGADFTSIQPAINSSQPGDTVVVAPGVYSGNVTIGDGVFVIAPEGATIAAIGNDKAVRFQDHVIPAHLEGFTIKHPPGFFTAGSGIYISNASPRIRNCRIRDNQANTGGGLLVVGNSAPVLESCRISTNKAVDGAGIAVWGIGANQPTIDAVSCVVADNETAQSRGGGVWIQYDTAPSASSPPPKFSYCRIDSNVAQIGGAALWLSNARSTTLHGCLITSNELGSTSYSGIIDGVGSGVKITQSTLADNTMSGTGTFYVVGLTGFPGVPGSVNASHAIFAHNNQGIAFESPASVLATYCDFFGNLSGDSQWLTPPSNGNINSNPAFSSLANDDFRLFCFSLCAPYSFGVPGLGALPVCCAPATAINYSTIPNAGAGPVTLCPKGDGAHELRVTVDLADAVVTRTLDAPEFQIVFNEGTVFRYGEGVGALSPATAANSYTAILSVTAGGGSGIDSATVFLDDVLLAGVRLPLVRSPDFIPDGWVTLNELSAFGASYTSPPKPYDPRCDFNNDGLVTVADWATLGAHHNHKYVPPQQPVSPVPASPGFGVELEVTELAGEKLYGVGVHLKEIAPFEIAVMAISFDPSRLEYVGWLQSSSYNKEAMVAETDREGQRVVFIGVLESKESYDANIDIGEMMFRLKDDELPVVASDFKLEIGEALLNGGALALSSALQVNVNEPQRFHNALYQNYPNPFNPNTTIRFACEASSHVTLKVYSVTGALVRTLIEDMREAGLHKLTWNGRNDNGEMVASGAYFYELRVGGLRLSRKMVLLK